MRVCCNSVRDNRNCVAVAVQHSVNHGHIYVWVYDVRCTYTNWKEAALTKNYKLREKIGTNGHQETKEKPNSNRIKHKSPEEFRENGGNANTEP